MPTSQRPSGPSAGASSSTRTPSSTRAGQARATSRRGAITQLSSIPGTVTRAARPATKVGLTGSYLQLSIPVRVNCSSGPAALANLMAIWSAAAGSLRDRRRVAARGRRPAAHPHPGGAREPVPGQVWRAWTGRWTPSGRTDSVARNRPPGQSSRIPRTVTRPPFVPGEYPVLPEVGSSPASSHEGSSARRWRLRQR